MYRSKYSYPFNHLDYPRSNRDVKTSNASSYDDGEGKFIVMGAPTRRTWCKDQNAAIDHATNFITRDGGKGEFLILKVVARVKPKGKKFPTKVELIK